MEQGNVSDPGVKLQSGDSEDNITGKIPNFEALVLKACSTVEPQYPHVKRHVQSKMGRALTPAEKTAIRTCLLNVASRSLTTVGRTSDSYTQELVLIISSAPMVWENQRWNMQCKPHWGSTFPGHLLPVDPLKWSVSSVMESGAKLSNRSQSMDRSELVPDLAGGAVWRVDKSVPRCDEDGWQ
jgi:hypothetical protein